MIGAFVINVANISYAIAKPKTKAKIAAKKTYNLAAWGLSDDIMYNNGENAVLEISKANENKSKLEAAAKNGDHNAQLILGLLLVNESDANDAKATELFKKAALKGNKHAAFLIGLKKAYMIEKPEDNLEVAKWWEMAANNGHKIAMAELSDMYLSDTRDFPKNEKRAHYWLEKSVNAGNEFSKLDLAIDYIDGRGTAKNIPKGKDILLGLVKNKSKFQEQAKNILLEKLEIDCISEESKCN